MTLQQVGSRVFEARVQKKMTQADVAAAAQVGRKLVNALENGKLADIGYVRLAAIMAAVGLELGERAAPPRPDCWL